MCGKKTLKNQRCWLQDVSCGMPCGKTLKCGSHVCRKSCHRPVDCEDSHGERCTQPCMKEKSACGHPHTEESCHAPFACKEEKPCQSKIYITCACQAQKQEMKCGASKGSEGNAGKSLPCTDECARLERNRKLALALNIDQASHVDGGNHIPYSTETLSLFAEHAKWGQTHEREFRVFASSDEERRLRFQPMKPQQRAFIHALAEDFGFDSESMDPEPHRHVMIWKTPRFVAAPNKTLADALRIRKAEKSATASANVSDAEDGVRKAVRARQAAEPYNAFLVSNPRFGLTVDELQAEVVAQVSAKVPITFNVEFLPNEDVVLQAVSGTLAGEGLQQALQGLRTAVAAAIVSKGYGSIQLCTLDSSLNILRRESDAPSGDGWSRVAAKKAAPRIVVQNGGIPTNSNGFGALAGSKVTFTTKKKPAKAKTSKPVVVDDWEAAELAEEEQEKVASEGEVKADGDDDRLDTFAGGADDAARPSEASEEAKSLSVALPAHSGESAAEKHDWASETEGSLQ